jgi:hypothetical protein
VDWKLIFEGFQDIGFPMWSAVVLYAVIRITSIVRLGAMRLEENDRKFNERFEIHIVEADKRMSLIEQLLEKHDQEIQELKGINHPNGHRR